MAKKSQLSVEMYQKPLLSYHGRSYLEVSKGENTHATGLFKGNFEHVLTSTKSEFRCFFPFPLYFRVGKSPYKCFLFCFVLFFKASIYENSIYIRCFTCIFNHINPPEVALVVHFSYEMSEIQEIKVICLKSHWLQVGELKCKSIFLAVKFLLFTYTILSSQRSSSFTFLFFNTWKLPITLE